MADAKTAIEFVLRQEDSTLSGKVTDDAGGRTRFGIAERWHPVLGMAGFYTCPAPEAQATAESMYESGYWLPLNAASVSSQEFANRLLSFAVNLGTHKAVTILQQCLAALGHAIGVDGDPGPSTISALNAQLVAGEAALMTEWRDSLTIFYQRVVTANPAQGKYLQGWLNRVKA
jgi:lysozyme family protein